jgi:hypothetical protein
LRRSSAVLLLLLASSAAACAQEPLAVAAQYVGMGDVTHHHGLPWCKFFVNFVLRISGYYVQESGRAADCRLLGPPTSPHPGAIAWTWHHCAFVARVDGDGVVLLGGNQTGGRVSYMRTSRRGMHFVEPRYAYAGTVSHNWRW